MPVNGARMDPRLHELFASSGSASSDLDWFDAHTHMGHNDPDGLSATPEEILEALDVAGQRRALIFAMHEPDGYSAANDAVFAACAASGGRLVPLARIDPKKSPAIEAERCLEAGARGFKLHPRSDDFPMPHPGAETIVAIAAEHRMPVMIHAGRGIPHLGEAAVDYARRYPDARLILAHAGISDLGALDGDALDLPNLLFDTSWWMVSDQLQLFTTIPPGRILYASDAPYGPPLFGGWAVPRLARAVGLAPEALRSIAGDQIERILTGEDLADVGRPPGTGVLGARSPRTERAIAYLAAAAMGVFRRFDPTEALQLACAACLTTEDGEEAELLGTVAELAQLALGALADTETRLSPIMPILAAQVIAGTAAAGVERLPG
jgi:predicted TIM-barrel fold metal-dependent hydrolase